MDRILQNTSAQIELQLADANGDPLDFDAAPSVEIFDGAGTSVITDTATELSPGLYGYTVAASSTATLDAYRVTWTGTIAGASNTFTTRYEVVGGFYFSIAEARAAQSGKLADATTYPTADLEEARTAVEDEIENRSGVAFVPRGRRTTLDGTDTLNLLLPDQYARELYSISRDGTALTASDYSVYDVGTIVSTSGFVSGTRNYALHYAYGLDEPPSRVKRIALKLLVAVMTGTTDDREVRQETMGSYSVTYAADAVLTGEENEILDSYRVPTIG